jgi:MFS family permease
VAGVLGDLHADAGLDHRQHGVAGDGGQPGRKPAADAVGGVQLRAGGGHLHSRLGWIADRYGTRRTFLVAIILFTLGSLACALAQHLHQLVGARVLQGIGGAMLLPVGRLAVMRSVPREDFLRAMSFIAIPALVGPLIGPTLGGWLVEIASWHWVFLINLPIGVIGFIAAMKIMPDHYASHRTRFDLRGYIMLAFAMVVLSLALDGISGSARHTRW